MAVEDKVFDLMNEGGESIDLFSQEGDLKNRIIGNIPEGATMEDVSHMISSLVDQGPDWLQDIKNVTHKGEDFSPNKLLGDVFKEVMNSKDLIKAHPRLASEIKTVEEYLINNMAQEPPYVQSRDGVVPDIYYGQAVPQVIKEPLTIPQPKEAGEYIPPGWDRGVSHDPESYDYFQGVADLALGEYAMKQMTGYDRRHY